MTRCNLTYLSAITFAFLPLTAACPAQSQTPAPPGAVTVIHPTDNGYADLKAACDAISQRPMLTKALAPGEKPPVDVLDQAQASNATLAEKRAAMRDPRMEKAHALLRGAMLMPRIAPSSDTQMEDFSLLARVRALAHLLGVQEYVQLADGSTAAAIDTLEELTALGDAVQRWGITGAILGKSLVAIGIKPIALHLDRLSTGDCERIQSLMKTELSAPDPAIDGIHAESVLAVGSLSEFLTKAIDAAPDNDEEPLDEAAVPREGPTGADTQALVALRKGPPEGWRRFMVAIEKRITVDTNALAESLASYPAAPDTTVPAPPQSPHSAFDALVEKAANMANPYGLKRHRPEVVDTLVTERARLQLLNIHAAIHRYKWEHNAYPASLDALRLGPFATDPFTGDSARYQLAPDAGSYTLSFAGPPARDSSGNALPNGKRTPLTLP